MYNILIVSLLIHSTFAFSPRSNHQHHHRMIQYRLTYRTVSTTSSSSSSSLLKQLFSASATKTIEVDTPQSSSSSSSQQHNNNNNNNNNNISTHDGGIPIGAVQLGSIHVQKFNNLINQSLTKTGKYSLSYRGVQRYIGPRNITDKDNGSSLLLLHVPPIVATALDDDHPDLVEFLKLTNGVYLPGVRRSRTHRNATRRKRNANIKEQQSSSTTASSIVATKSMSTVTTAIESSSEEPSSYSFTFSELFAGIGGFRLGLNAM